MSKKREKYIEGMYNIMNQYIESRPVFIQSRAADQIIVGTKEEDDHLTVLLKNAILSDEEDRLYLLTYNGVVIDADQMVISDDDDGNIVQFYSYSNEELHPTLNFKMALNQFIKIDLYDEVNNIYEVRVEEIPPWLMAKNPNLEETMDIFPVIYSTERVDIINGVLNIVTRIFVYFPGQFTPVLFDIVTTSVDLAKSGIHDNKVNLIKSKIRTNKDIINVVPGSIIVQDVKSMRSPHGFVSNLFLIDDINDDHIKASVIDGGDEINIRYSHLLNDGMYIIPYYEHILQYPVPESTDSTTDDNYSPFLLPSINKDIYKFGKHIKNDIDIIVNAETVVYETDANKINDLVEKKLNGKRIDRKRNSNLKYVRELFESATKAAEAVERLCNQTEDDTIRIYNHIDGILTSYDKYDNIFTGECQKLNRILSLIGKSKGEK